MAYSQRTAAFFLFLFPLLAAPNLARTDVQQAMFPALGLSFEFPDHWSVLDYQTDGGPSQDRVLTAKSSRDRQSFECNYMKMLSDAIPKSNEDKDALLHASLRTILAAEVDYKSSMDGPFVRTTRGLRNILARIASENPAYQGNIAVYQLIVSGEYFLLCTGFHLPGDENTITSIAESITTTDATSPAESPLQLE